MNFNLNIKLPSVKIKLVGGEEVDYLIGLDTYVDLISISRDSNGGYSFSFNHDYEHIIDTIKSEMRDGFLLSCCYPIREYINVKNISRIIIEDDKMLLEDEYAEVSVDRCSLILSSKATLTSLQ